MSGRCERHRSEPGRGRPSAHRRGYSAKWRKARLAFLAQHPLCMLECAAAGVVTPATVVDHIKPHRGDQALFWDSTNWQPACKRCHDRKTARHDRRG